MRPPATSADELARRVRADIKKADAKLRMTPQEIADGMRDSKAKFRDARTAIEAQENTRIQVISEGRIYHPGSAYSFTRDLVAAKAKDPEATSRLLRNNAEFRDYQLRAGVTQTAGSGGEFVAPMWLVEQAAQLFRAGRPFLNALGTHPLPKLTNQLNFPKITTGATVAEQTDGTATSNTDLATGTITAQVQTAAGRSVVSYQVSDLSSAADPLILQDLMYAANTQFDRDALAGSNVTNAKSLLNTAGTNSVTYTDATPTGPEFWAPVTQGAAKIGKVGAAPSFAVTAPSIWWSIAGSLDTTNLHPIFASVGSGQRMIGTSDSSDSTPMLAGESDGLFGNIAGVPVCVDANMPTNLGAGTNEARLVVLNRMGFDVWESPPYFKVADNSTLATNLQNQLEAVIYWTCASRQPTLVSVVSGTGMIPPAAYL